jgi:hypothetical protein
MRQRRFFMACRKNGLAAAVSAIGLMDELPPSFTRW